MTQSDAIGIVQQGLLVIVYASAPPLLIGLVIGVVVSIFQAVTSIQEPTLAFVPKILAVFAAIYIFGSWMMGIIQQLAIDLFSNIPSLLSR